MKLNAREEANGERSSEDEADTVLSTSQIGILEDYALRKHGNETEGEREDGSERKKKYQKRRAAKA